DPGVARGEVGVVREGDVALVTPDVRERRSEPVDRTLRAVLENRDDLRGDGGAHRAEVVRALVGPLVDRR
ncbi:MAG: hypothetical protein ACK559_04180, partial [bacterium]